MTCIRNDVDSIRWQRIKCVSHILFGVQLTLSHFPSLSLEQSIIPSYLTMSGNRSVFLVCRLFFRLTYNTMDALTLIGHKTPRQQIFNCYFAVAGVVVVTCMLSLDCDWRSESDSSTGCNHLLANLFFVFFVFVHRSCVCLLASDAFLQDTKSREVYEGKTWDQQSTTTTIAFVIVV